jgi:hypothetical protein
MVGCCMSLLSLCALGTGEAFGVSIVGGLSHILSVLFAHNFCWQTKIRQKRHDDENQRQRQTSRPRSASPIGEQEQEKGATCRSEGGNKENHQGSREEEVSARSFHGFREHRFVPLPSCCLTKVHANNDSFFPCYLTATKQEEAIGRDCCV